MMAIKVSPDEVRITAVRTQLKLGDFEKALEVAQNIITINYIEYAFLEISKAQALKGLKDEAQKTHDVGYVNCIRALVGEGRMGDALEAYPSLKTNEGQYQGLYAIFKACIEKEDHESAKAFVPNLAKLSGKEAQHFLDQIPKL